MQLPRKMSAHNVMASISRSLGNRESKETKTEVRFAGEERKDKLYETKHKQKVVRVLTVVAYVIFVSKAAILLSLYYTFVWNPKDQSIRMIRPEKPECVTKPHDSHTSPAISNDTQIEKLTARPTTMDNKQSEELDLSTTQQQRGLWNILTGRTDAEETSVEFTSTSTVQDYRNNFTSTVNDGDDENVT